MLPKFRKRFTRKIERLLELVTQQAMRKTYGTTDQTVLAIIGKEQAIAAEMDCHPTYIYGMKDRDNPDPYARFRPLYRAAVRAGSAHCHWDNDMAAIRAEADDARKIAEPMALLLKKVRSDGDLTADILEALGDGVLTEPEIHKILKGIKAVRKNADDIESALLKQLGKLRSESWMEN